MAKILKAKRNFNFYIEDFMEYCKLKGLSRKTMKSYESSLLLFSKYIEEEYQLSKVEEIKLTHAKEYVKFTKERGKYSYVSDDKTVSINNPSNINIALFAKSITFTHPTTKEKLTFTLDIPNRYPFNIF